VWYRTAGCFFLYFFHREEYQPVPFSFAWLDLMGAISSNDVRKDRLDKERYRTTCGTERQACFFYTFLP